ncbi:hypothetical protein HY501_01365 [Candidatus Woesearchaeota archaeon]|nr:hypothetical protein [Candidatus Woesearchaeota archaeon]
MAFNLKNLGSVLIAASIILVFLLTIIKVDNDQKSLDLCSKYEDLGLSMEQCPAHKTTFSWTIIASYTLGVLILVLGFYLLILPVNFLEPSSTEAKREFKPVNLERLSEDEKKIYDILKLKDGSAYQTDLIKETGFSKVKITRVLDKMEFSGCLERKRRGMTNIIVLK